MRFDLDTYKEILDTITRNKSRSLLTGFGVFWGVFMLIVLMGGGQGLKELLQANFSGFATNTAVIWAQNTTKPYKGFNKGRSWQMEEKDLERLRQRMPELDVITPLLFGGRKNVVFADKSFSGSAQGVNSDYAKSLFQRCFMADTSTIWMCASSARYVSLENRSIRISFQVAATHVARRSEWIPPTIP